MKYLLILCFLLSFTSIHAQSDYYIIGDDASVNLNFSDNPNGDKGILFEAKPIVRYKLHNNIEDRLKDPTYRTLSSSYLLFSPHLRMYNENSEPVKMPSYRVAFGYQKAWKLKKKNPNYKGLIAFAGEHGHYSNGQSGCAFSNLYEDDSAPCNTIYNTINNNQNINLSSLLNRSNGHFQTNYTSLFLNYRTFKLKDRDSAFYHKSHSVSFKYTLFHRNVFLFVNYGGYSQNDIQIYGRHRFNIDYSYSCYGPKKTVLKFSQQLGFIAGAHKSVTNYRSVTSLTFYPLPKHVNLGFKAAYVFGHDDYNIRFVDNVSQVTISAVFSPFGLFSMNN